MILLTFIRIVLEAQTHFASGYSLVRYCHKSLKRWPMDGAIQLHRARLSLFRVALKLRSFLRNLINSIEEDRFQFLCSFIINGK